MRRKSKLFVRYVALIAAVSLPLSHSGQAASATWNPTPGDANWIPTTGDTDWNTGVNTNPGSTSSLTNADVATFNSASTQTTIAINSATLDIGGITFDTNAASYTIGASGANGGNSLLLSSGGTVQIASTFLGNGTTETINAPVVIEAASSSSIGTYTFANNSTNGSDVLNFAGAITGGTTTATNGNDSGQEGGSIVLLLTGANTGANTLSGAITDGSSQAVVPVSQRGVAINKTGSGIWYLTNNGNTYTGETAIEAGVLNVSSLSNYGVASAIGARTASEESNANGGIGLLIAGGTLQYTGASNQSTNRQIRLGNGATDAIDVRLSSREAIAAPTCSVKTWSISPEMRRPWQKPAPAVGSTPATTRAPISSRSAPAPLPSPARIPTPGQPRSPAAHWP
jgi:autotransporter-associated beta strand protein